MKALLIGECRAGEFLETTYELLGFAAELQVKTAMLLVGNETQLPGYDGTLYLCDAAACGEYDPDRHKKLILEAVQIENPDYIIFLHSSYGWDLAPRVAASLKTAQISEICAIRPDGFEVSCCNGKMRRTVKPASARAVLTIQTGAFPARHLGGPPLLQRLTAQKTGTLEFCGYEPCEKKAVDLTRTNVIVAAGRGVGSKQNVPAIAALASALGGELAASRPAVDADWVEHSLQVGITGQVVSPKLYVACGISGAIQHLAGIRRSDFIVAINKDKNAPIAEVADVMVVADVMQFVTLLTAKIGTQA